MKFCKRKMYALFQKLDVPLSTHYANYGIPLHVEWNFLPVLGSDRWSVQISKKSVQNR